MPGKTRRGPATWLYEHLSKRYTVGIPDASPFTFRTARQASRFLSDLQRAHIGTERPGRPAPVYRWDPKTRTLKEVW